MKTKDLMSMLIIACINRDKVAEKEIWLEILKKSLKRKKTYAVK